MLWTSSEAIESTKKKPKFLRAPLRVARRRADYGKLIRWENALTKGISAITLMQRAMFFNCETDKKMKGIPTKHWIKTVAF